jgi:DNA polymerase-3 subunit epsilon
VGGPSEYPPLASTPRLRYRSRVRDTLYAYLLERPSGASPRELLDLVFTQPGADPEFGPRFLHALLGADPRFAWRAADGRWVAAVHALLAQPLEDTTFVVVDLETTGLGAHADGIIELGAARVRNGRLLEQFEQLVNPGTPLSPFITRLTGIDDTMLAAQPGIAAVWPRFLAFVGDAVLVAHNAAFDMGFLNAVARHHDGTALPNPSLCTLKLARRLVPEVRRRGLDGLAAHFAIPQQDRHRALGDVRITVEVFFHLLERMAARGIVRLDQALDLQHQARDGRRFVCLLPRQTVQHLPASPGIYRFLDAAGRVLYVGKATNLRERVGSYLSNAAGHSDKTLDLIRHARDVRVAVHDSALEAALEEAAAIRREKPSYNRLGKHLPRIAFLKLGLRDRYPRLSIVTRVSSGTARYAGPFKHRAEAERVLGLLTRLFRLRTCTGTLCPDEAAAPCFQGQIDACTAPCAARCTADDYGRQVAACLAVFDGDGSAAEAQLISRRAAHAASLRFEAADHVQRDLRLLERVVRRQRMFGWIAAGGHFLLLQPTADHRAVRAYAVLRGRLALRERLHDPDEVYALGERIGEVLRRAPGRRVDGDVVDGTTIVAAWLRDNGETAGCVFRATEAAAAAADWPAAQVGEWRAACATLLTAPRLPEARTGAARAGVARPVSASET